MRYIVTLLFCFTLFAASAQIRDTAETNNKAQTDSGAAVINPIEINMHSIDSANMARNNAQMIQNLNSFMADRRQQERKQLRQTYLRLGFGVFMLIVLIVGLVRRRKVKQ